MEKKNACFLKLKPPELRDSFGAFEIKKKPT